MEKRSRLLAILCSASLAYGGSAVAVEARLFQLGDGGAIAPHLTIEYGNDNNPLRQDAGSEASNFLRLMPRVRYVVQQRNNRLQFRYRGNYLNYSGEYCRDQVGTNGVNRPGDCQFGSPAFDKASYEDHILEADAFLEVSRKFRATLQLSRELSNQPIGTGLSANPDTLSSLAEPDSYLQTIARAEFSYGAEQARGEVRFGLTYNDKAFVNDATNPGRNADFQNLNENSLSPSASVLYRLGTRTQAFIGLGTSKVRGGDSQRDITRRFAGVEFDASAITSGSIRVSDVTEDFLLNRRDLNYAGWDVELSWKPRRFSTVTVGGGRETERGVGNDNNDIGIVTKIDVNWLHLWDERLSSDASVSWLRNKDVDIFSSGGPDSEDETIRFRLGGNYSLRRWLDVGGFVDLRDYERTVVGISANGTI